MENKKLSILYVWNILKKYSDEEHPLTQQRIIELVEMNYGVSLERKSVSNNLILLGELDYDIVSVHKKGYYLGEREFNQTEISYLIDAIFSSKSIPASRAKELTNKIVNSLSVYQRKDYSYIFKSSQVNRTSNKQVFYNIELINDAIKNKKMIAFYYLGYDESGKRVQRKKWKYKTSPFFLINNFGRYYVVGSRYQDGIVNYRVDYMDDIEFYDGEYIPLESMEKMKNFDIADYINSHVYIFGGEVITAKIRLSGVEAIGCVKDWFGENTKINQEDGQMVTYIKCDDKALLYWLLQYGEQVEILEPTSLRENYINTLHHILEKYKEE